MEANFTKSDLQRAFGITYQELDKVIVDAGAKLPKTRNILNQFKIYGDETIDYIEKTYKLKADRSRLK